jgi:hypothetical protein
MPVLTLKHSEAERAAWRASADKLRVPLTTWMRLKLNEAAPPDAPVEVQDAKPAKPAGRPRKTYEKDFAEIRTAGWDGEQRLFTTVRSDLSCRRMPDGRVMTLEDAPRAHELYEKCTRATWSPRRNGVYGDGIREYLSYLDDCKRRRS